MNNIKTYNQFNSLNEKISFDSFKEKLQKLVNKFLNKLSPEQISKLKTELLPYKGLTRKEIEEKIRLKLNVNESILKNMQKDIDPYGEEEWDTTIEEKRYRKRKIMKEISLIFNMIGVLSLILFPFSLLVDLIISSFVNPKFLIVEYDFYILISSWFLFFVCNYIWKKI